MNILSFEEDVKAAFDKSIQKIKSLIKIIDDKIKSINSEISNVNKEIRDKIGLEHTKQIEIDLRELAEKRLQRTKTIKQKYIEKKKDLDQLISERNKIIDKLQASIDSITSTRSRSNTAIEQKLNKFKITGLNISIFFKAGNDRQQFVTFLHDFLIGTHSRYKSRKYPEIIAHHFDPIKFSDILFKKDSAPLIDRDISVDGKNFAIETEYINGLFELKSHVSYDEYSDLEKVNKDNLTKLLEMQEVYWDDYESILLNNRPVEDLSPGQRSSAMLPLIVLSEVAPLVVDQPEDNLDNRLVGQVLVNILAELKEKRQLIIATHNPNILVSGDSEQVVVLEAVSDKEGNVSAQASIDDNDIIKTVIDIMEGGKRAFDARNARYGLIMKA